MMLTLIGIPLMLSPVVYVVGRRIAQAAQGLTLLALAGLWVMAAALARELSLVSAAEGVSAAQNAVAFRFDGLSLLITVVVLFLSTLVTLYSGANVRGMEGEEKYYAMLLMMTGAVIGLVCAADLFNLWLWFEMMAISSYLLVSFYHERKHALAACAKYLIQTATGSVLVLFAVALVYAQTGSLDFAQIAAQTALPVTPLMVVAGVLFVMGFGVKLALVPTYTWLADAYAQAPIGITALLSGIVTISGLAALARTLAMLGGMAVEWGALLIALGTVNLILGNALALGQREVKRIFAYSSISHIGLIVLAVGIGIYAHQISGFQSGMLHLFNHAMMKALAFLALGAAVGGLAAPHLEHLRGLAARDPITAGAMTIACLSLGGIPPLAGFMSKWQILSAGLESESTILIVLMIVVALNSAFSLAYYLPIINVMYQAGGSMPKKPLSMGGRIAMITLTAAVILPGIFPALTDWLVLPASQALMGLFGG